MKKRCVLYEDGGEARAIMSPPGRQTETDGLGLRDGPESGDKRRLAWGREEVWEGAQLLVAAPVGIEAEYRGVLDQDPAVGQLEKDRVCPDAVSAGGTAHQRGKTGLLAEEGEGFGGGVDGLVYQDPDAAPEGAGLISRLHPVADSDKVGG